MEKFKDVVIKLTENADPDLKILIQEHLNKFTNGFHTPDHPPYAAMIHRAIVELNKKRGSSEESISEYIKKRRTDLPLAHNSLLKHHLGKLCESGEIVMTGKHLYLLPGSNPTLEACVKTVENRQTRKRRGRKCRGRVGKKYRMNTDRDEETHGMVHVETDWCNKEPNELIGDNNEMKLDNKFDRVGELDQVREQTEQENRMLDEQSRLRQQQSHVICAPAVDLKQPELSSPDRPPGFESINLQSKQIDSVVQKEPELISNSGRLSETETLQHVDPEQWRQGQPNCKYKLHSKCSKSGSPDVSTELLPSQNQQQRMDQSNSDGLHGVKSKDLKLLEAHPPKFKQYGRRKKLQSMTKEKEMQDVAAEVEQKTEQVDLSDLGKSSQPVSSESQQIQEWKEKQTSESKQQVTSTYYDVDMAKKQQYIVKQHDKSVSNDPIEQQGTKSVGQVVRRSQRLAKYTQTHLSLDLLPKSQYLQVEELPQLKMEVDYNNLAQKLQQLQLPAVDSVQATKQTIMESSESSPDQVQMVKTSKLLQQRSKLRSWQKWCTSQENMQTARSGSSLTLGQAEQVQQEPLRLEQVQQEPLRLEQVQQEPLRLEYYQDLVASKELSKQAHPKLPGETELEAYRSTRDMPPSHERQPQVHGVRGRRRGRPPGVKNGQRSMQNP